MLKVRATNKFKKDLKLISKRGHDVNILMAVVKKLANQEVLPASNRDHELTGNYVGFRECHIASDWLLVYKINKSELVLILSRTGSHSDLF